MFFFRLHLKHFFLRMTLQLVERTICLATLFLALEVNKMIVTNVLSVQIFSNVGKTTLCHYLPNNTKNKKQRFLIETESLRLFSAVVKKTTLCAAVWDCFQKVGTKSDTPRSKDYMWAGPGWADCFERRPAGPIGGPFGRPWFNHYCIYFIFVHNLRRSKTNSRVLSALKPIHGC